MVGYTGVQPHVSDKPPAPVELGKADQEFVVGYQGFVPGMKSSNVVAQAYGTATRNFFQGNLQHGPQGRELDNMNPQDRFTSTNDLQYLDLNHEEHDRLKRYIRPASAHVNIPGFSSKIHNQQLTIAKHVQAKAEVPATADAAEQS